MKAKKLLLSDNKYQGGFSEDDLKSIKDQWPAINWKILPPDAHHRLGGPESMVKAIKRSLVYLPTNNISYTEFDCVIQQICSVINNRPLGFLKDSEEILCPNHLMLGRTYDPVLPHNQLSDIPVTALHSHVKNVINGWFERWNCLVLPRLYNISKWRKEV